MLGHPSLGSTKSSFEKPKFFKALAQAPIFSPSCGLTKINPIFLGIMLHFLEDRIESLGEGSTGEIELYKDVLLDFEITKPSEAIRIKLPIL